MEWLRVPKKIYFKRGSTPVALKELSQVYGLERAFLLSDAAVYVEGIPGEIRQLIRKGHTETAEFIGVQQQATFADAKSGLPKMDEFQPDVIVGIGGTAVLDMAKIMWLMYEHPQLDIDQLVKTAGKPVSGDPEFPVMGNKAMLILIPTVPEAGAECSPFATAVDENGKSCTIAGYNLLPEMVVIDADMMRNVSSEKLEACGKDICKQAETTLAMKEVDDYVIGFAKDALRMATEALPDVVSKENYKRENAIEKMANAATLAGIATANAIY